MITSHDPSVGIIYNEKSVDILILISLPSFVPGALKIYSLSFVFSSLSTMYPYNAFLCVYASWVSWICWIIFVCVSKFEGFFSINATHISVCLFFPVSIIFLYFWDLITHKFFCLMNHRSLMLCLYFFHIFFSMYASVGFIIIALAKFSFIY